MSEEDFSAVCSTIEGEREFLNSVSQDIWCHPQLAYEEEHAHELLSGVLSNRGFQVQKGYVVPTAFRAEFQSKADGGPVIAVLLEYDALPEIGHACGHNLIAEAGLAASLAIKAVMEADPELVGKLVVLGTPAEEGAGGKVDLLRGGAFEGVDAAMMVHPCNYNTTSPPILCLREINVDFKGKEVHAAATPWKGRNALDAAVAAYVNISLLRQHMKPTDMVHAIITKGGLVPNVIPAESRLEIYVRAATRIELADLTERVLDCIRSGERAAGCTASIQCDMKGGNENLISNRVMAQLYDTYTKRLGIHPTDFSEEPELSSGSTDMGNVSHAVPSIQPMYNINTESLFHTTEFQVASGDPKAQDPTLNVAKAMATIALKLMRCPETLAKAKKEFEDAIAKGF